MRVITLGTFDLFHYGHLNLIQLCYQLGGGSVVVGLNTDEFVSRYKGKPPIMSYDERSRMLKQACLVDVVPNDQSDGSAKQVILDSGAQVIVIGSDWARKDYVGQLGLDWDWLDEHGIGICYFPYTKGISSTEIKRRVQA